MKWIHSLRLTLGFFAGMVVLLSFKVADTSNENSFLCAITAVVIACATMVQNDWRDRFHDTKKGICLAFDNPKKFFDLAVVLWALAGSLSLGLVLRDCNLGLLAWLLIASGLIYSETRKIPLASISLVCVTWASLVLFPIFIGPNSFQIGLLFFYLLLTIFGREIITDLKDVSADANYKWTIPQKLGIQKAEIIAIIFIMTGVIVMNLISIKALLGLPFTMVATVFLLKRKDYKISKTFFDLGMVTAILMLYM